ncbi:MAG: DUF3572 domain-containing protein [Pseudolabrys sp.]
MARNRPSSLTREVAEHVAIQALSFIAGEPERLGGFLAATGIGPDRIRAAAREPGFLGGVLDYLTGDEAMLLAFADEASLAPDLIEKARMVLGAGDWERETP